METVIAKLKGIWFGVLNSNTSKEGKEILNRIKTPTKIDEFFIYCDQYRVWRGTEFKVLKYHGTQTRLADLNAADKILIKRQVKLFSFVKGKCK